MFLMKTCIVGSGSAEEEREEMGESEDSDDEMLLERMMPCRMVLSESRRCEMVVFPYDSRLSMMSRDPRQRLLPWQKASEASVNDRRGRARESWFEVAKEYVVLGDRVRVSKLRRGGREMWMQGEGVRRRGSAT